MTLTSKTLAVLVFALLFGGIFFSSAVGWWQTESGKQAAVFTDGAYAGQANPADIRGSYTLGDVERNFAVPAEVTAAAFGVQAEDPAAFQVKSLEELYAASPEEVGTGSVRLFVAFYTGLPIDLSSHIYLPAPAAVLLRGRSLTAEQAAYLEAHTVSYPPAGDGVQAAQPAAQAAQPGSEQPNLERETGHSGSEDRQIRGRTTFDEIMGWGVSPEAIEEILGQPIPRAAGSKVKEFCTAEGLRFETIKGQLQAEVGK